MADRTKIEWADATVNAINGCTLVSEGCRHCYAARLAATRMQHHPSRAGLARVNAAGEAKFTGEVRLNETALRMPLSWRKPRAIFWNAHGDTFHENVPDDWIDRMMAVIALTPQHRHMVLTKRPERARRYLDRMTDDYSGDPSEWGFRFGGAARRVGATLTNSLEAGFRSWPLSNLWLGTSIEDQATADARIPHLLATPAAVRFVSAEPLLGPVDLTRIAGRNALTGKPFSRSAWSGLPFTDAPFPSLNWLIVGGESGPHARPANPQWFRDLRDQCVAAGVAFHFKQWGEWASVSEVEGPGPIHEFPGGRCTRRVGKARAGRLLDGRTWDEVPG